MQQSCLSPLLEAQALPKVTQQVGRANMLLVDAAVGEDPIKWLRPELVASAPNQCGGDLGPHPAFTKCVTIAETVPWIYLHRSLISRSRTR
eukprot:3073746-Pyramimonas_sp.AAC.1